MPDLFTPDGIAAWRATLERSAAFREAAGNWTGTLLLVEGDADAPTRTTYLALTDGAIVAARPGATGDDREAEFVLAADRTTWDALVAGREDLLGCAMRGALRLVRGQVFRLLPHARAAAAMLRAAAGAP